MHGTRGPAGGWRDPWRRSSRLARKAPTYLHPTHPPHRRGRPHQHFRNVTAPRGRHEQDETDCGPHRTLKAAGSYGTTEKLLNHSELNVTYACHDWTMSCFFHKYWLAPKQRPRDLTRPVAGTVGMIAPQRRAVAVRPASGPSRARRCRRTCRGRAPTAGLTHHAVTVAAPHERIRGDGRASPARCLALKLLRNWRSRSHCCPSSERLGNADRRRPGERRSATTDRLRADSQSGR